MVAAMPSSVVKLPSEASVKVPAATVVIVVKTESLLVEPSISKDCPSIKPSCYKTARLSL